MPATPDDEQPRQHPVPIAPPPILEGPLTDDDALDAVLFGPHADGTPRTGR